MFLLVVLVSGEHPGILECLAVKTPPLVVAKSHRAFEDRDIPQGPFPLAEIL